MTEQNKFTIVGRGSEAPIETAIREHLAADGWSVEDRPKATGVDIVAHRDGRRLLIEVKGDTGPTRAWTCRRSTARSSSAWWIRETSLPSVTPRPSVPRSTASLPACRRCSA